METEPAKEVKVSAHSRVTVPRTVEESMVEARMKVEKLLRFIDKALINKTDVTVLEELELAKRHLEDARMRLGVAMTYHKGFDPWSATSAARRTK